MMHRVVASSAVLILRMLHAMVPPIGCIHCVRVLVHTTRNVGTVLLLLKVVVRRLRMRAIEATAVVRGHFWRTTSHTTIPLWGVALLTITTIVTIARPSELELKEDQYLILDT